MRMSLEENKDLVRRFYEAISAAGDLGVLDDVCSPTYAHRVGDEPHTLTWLRDIVRQFHTGFPDVRFAVEELIAEGDKVCARWTLRGTHLGEFQGNPATGQSIVVEDCFNIFRVAEGKLAEDRVHWGCQYHQIFAQIGGVPPQ
jgi:predicted ester cyclase